MKPATRIGWVLSAIAFLSLASAAGTSQWGEACNQDNTHLDSNTWALDTDCNPRTYCADNGTCAYKGCRKDIYPFGYNDVPFDQLPPMCPTGFFVSCPDEGDRCIEDVAVGGACQKDRDDQCLPAPNYKDISGYLNVNGSVCLNFTCYYADVNVGQTCVFDNTVYTAYADGGSQYAFIISRDNCANGLYCDGSTTQCLKKKLHGAACESHKECLSYNCDDNKVCGRAPDDQLRPPVWNYVLVGLGLAAFIAGIMVSLWFLHRRSRKENQVKLEQYYNEQIAYRQSIMSMNQAKNSLLSLPANTHPDVARKSMLGEEAFSYSAQDDMLPPNVRRDSSAAWSEADSEVLLVAEQPKYHGR